MSYTAYSTEDFLADETFQAFVLAADPAATQRWRGWVAQHPAKAAEFDEAVAVLELLKTRQPAPVSAALQRAELAKLWLSMKPAGARPALRSARAPRARRWAATAVAAVLLLLLAGVGLWRRPAPASAPALARYATPSGQHRQMQLPDGSRVTLNGNSVLTLAAAWQPGRAREVWLTGEAYFEVQHTAPAHITAVAGAPAHVKFVVHAGAVDVAVLGTTFNVLNRVGKTRVVLTTGQVQLSRRRAGRLDQLLLRPGELAECSEAAPLAKRAVQADFYSAWTSGQLNFDNTPVAEIVTLLEDTYSLRVTVGNRRLLLQKLTGSMPNADADVLLSALGKSLDVRVRRVGNHVWLD